MQLQKAEGGKWLRGLAIWKRQGNQPTPLFGPHPVKRFCACQYVMLIVCTYDCVKLPWKSVSPKMTGSPPIHSRLAHNQLCMAAPIRTVMLTVVMAEFATSNRLLRLKHNLKQKPSPFNRGSRLYTDEPGTSSWRDLRPWPPGDLSSTVHSPCQSSPSRSAFF